MERSDKEIGYAVDYTEMAAQLREAKERIKELETALDVAAYRFDGILREMPRLSKMTPTERMSHDSYVRNCRDEARALLNKK